MQSENFQIVKGRVVLKNKVDEAVLRYAAPKAKEETNAKTTDVEETPPSAKPLTVIKHIIDRLMKGDLKIADEVISNAAETINKSHQIAKDPNKELLKHLVDELVSGAYRCDENVLKGVAAKLNKAQEIDKFNHKEDATEE